MIARSALRFVWCWSAPAKRHFKRVKKAKRYRSGEAGKRIQARQRQRACALMT